MTGMRMAPEVRKEIERRLLDGAPVTRIAKDMGIWADNVRAIRDDIGVPSHRSGNRTPARSEPVRWDDTDIEDGDPRTVNPQRIPVGQWCIDRPNQARWVEMVNSAGDIELVYLRDAMCTVLGLRLGATSPEIEAALKAEHRLADDLAALYIKARGYGR